MRNSLKYPSKIEPGLLCLAHVSITHGVKSFTAAPDTALNPSCSNPYRPVCHVWLHVVYRYFIETPAGAVFKIVIYKGLFIPNRTRLLHPTIGLELREIKYMSWVHDTYTRCVTYVVMKIDRDKVTHEILGNLLTVYASYNTAERVDSLLFCH